MCAHIRPMTVEMKQFIVTSQPKPKTANPEFQSITQAFILTAAEEDRVYSQALDPSALNLKPSTLNPQPSTLNPQPSTLNPQPSTLNPQPSTPNPKPWALNLNP